MQNSHPMPIEEILTSSDLVLLDNSFFCNNEHSVFCRDLHDVNDIESLDALTSRMIGLNSFLSYLYTNVVCAPNVFLTKESHEKLENLRKIFQDSNSFFRNKRMFPVKGASSGLNQLNGLWKNADRICRDIQLYNGRVDIVHPRREFVKRDILDNNYAILGAAIGHVLSVGTSANLLTRNRSFPLLLSDAMTGSHRDFVDELRGLLFVYLPVEGFEGYFRKYGIHECDIFSAHYLGEILQDFAVSN